MFGLSTLLPFFFLHTNASTPTLTRTTCTPSANSKSIELCHKQPGKISQTNLLLHPRPYLISNHIKSQSKAFFLPTFQKKKSTGNRVDTTKMHEFDSDGSTHQRKNTVPRQSFHVAVHFHGLLGTFEADKQLFRNRCRISLCLWLRSNLLPLTKEPLRLPCSGIKNKIIKLYRLINCHVATRNAR